MDNEKDRNQNPEGRAPSTPNRNDEPYSPVHVDQATDERAKIEAAVKDEVRKVLRVMMSEGGHGRGEGVQDTDNKALHYAGLAFIYVAVATVVAAVFMAILLLWRHGPPYGTTEFFSFYGLSLILLVAAALFASIGYLILQSIGAANEEQDCRKYNNGDDYPDPGHLQ